MKNVSLIYSTETKK